MVEIKSPKIGDHLSDEQAMQLAIAEAIKGTGYVSPNPRVGCVVLDSHNRFLSKGYHKKFGGPHAEIEAISGLSEALEGARIFVTLEPCAHQGKTPSCAKTLAKYPIKEVIYGLVDPNPPVSGKGAAILEQAGIRATLFEHLKDDLEEVCEHFLMNVQNQKPFVSVKVASSLDGQLGLKNNESKWITSELAREHGRFLRAAHDATLVGINTVLIDDPQLDIRHPKFVDKKNKVIVLDPSGRIFQTPGLKLFKTHHPEDLIIVVNDSKIKSEVAQVIVVGEDSNNAIDLKDLLIKLWWIGVRSILVEGGAQTISSFISQKEVNRLYLFQAPIILGAKTGKSWSEQVSIVSMSDRVTLRNPKVKKLGVDVLISGRVDGGSV